MFEGPLRGLSSPSSIHAVPMYGVDSAKQSVPRLDPPWSATAAISLRAFWIHHDAFRAVRGVTEPVMAGY